MSCHPYLKFKLACVAVEVLTLHFRKTPSQDVSSLHEVNNALRRLWARVGWWRRCSKIRHLPSEINPNPMAGRGGKVGRSLEGAVTNLISLHIISGHVSKLISKRQQRRNKVNLLLLVGSVYLFFDLKWHAFVEDYYYVPREKAFPAENDLSEGSHTQEMSLKRSVEQKWN